METEIFSKILTDTDVRYRMSVKSRSLKSFPQFAEGQLAQVVMVEDEEGEEWPFHLVIRKGRNRKPVFSDGWRQFVKSKGLEHGHKVQLFKEEDRATGVVKYKIKLQKEVLLFGAVVSYQPYRAMAVN